MKKSHFIHLDIHVPEHTDFNMERKSEFIN